MTKNLFVAIFLVGLMPFTACMAAENDDCAYAFQDAAAYKAPYQKLVKAGDLRSFKWDDKNHIAKAITREGDKVTATYYACFALGVDAILNTPNDTRESITRKILWLTGLALDAASVEKMKQELQRSEFTSHFKKGVFAGDRTYGLIPEAGYLNIEYSVDREGKDVEIEVTSSID